MNAIEKSLVDVFKKDKYDRDLYGIGIIIGMVIKIFIKKDEDGYSRSDFLKGINEGLSKSDEDLMKGK
jgi:hypothetical protein